MGCPEEEAEAWINLGLGYASKSIQVSETYPQVDCEFYEASNNTVLIEPCCLMQEFVLAVTDHKRVIAG